MLFNSIDFALFLPVVFYLYWAVNRNLKLQNVILLFASYFFYASWDYRFLFLLVFSTILDYTMGFKIHEAQNRRIKKYWLWFSLFINLGFLGVFKYYDFFVTSFAEGLSLLGLKANITTLNLILPVGISFYTFHGLSYVIDIYKDKIKPEKNFINYSVFVSFFPLLVAGPIERATHLLPQIHKKRKFDYLKTIDGLKQILWGLFKKVVIADNCADIVNLIFNNQSDFSGSTRVLGAVFFAFQIYADFSGYSDIALGTARLFGIELLKNFAFPYFSRDIAEFWRRWNISLTTWFRDYLYIPIGGSRGSTWLKVRNTFIVFLVSGFWHGANWTFIVWGALNALYFLPLLLLNKNRNHLETVAKDRYWPSIKELADMSITFILTVFAWIFFRSPSVSEALQFLSEIFSASLFTIPQVVPETLMALTILFIVIEWIGREREYAISHLGIKLPWPLRWAMYYSMLLVIFYFFDNTNKEFIYFQF